MHGGWSTGIQCTHDVTPNLSSQTNIGLQLAPWFDFRLFDFDEMLILIYEQEGEFWRGQTEEE